MDFKNANELLALCEEKNLPISEIMRIREIELGETASEIAVSYTHLDVYKRQLYTCCCYLEMIFFFIGFIIKVYKLIGKPGAGI